MFVVVPRRVGHTGVEVFVGAFAGVRPGGTTTLRLTPTQGGPAIERPLPGQWDLLEGGAEPAIHHHATLVSGLAPGTAFDLTLLDQHGHTVATGSFETLPERLPASGDGAGPDRPFTVWLSSCFHAPNASAGVETTVRALLADARYRPHLKILAGDQVYLDAPLPWTLFTPTEEQMRAKFNGCYARTWMHEGFQALLSSSATFFITDDHEYWNNYPNPPSPVLSPVRTRAFWESWRRLAMDERAVALQGGRRTDSFELAPGAPEGLPLSFFIADTRIDRDAEGRRFMSAESMQRLEMWMGALDGPGVLAVGQPVLAEPGGPGDWHLPSYLQFRHNLVEALARCKHDLLVLTGDSHYGRLAETELKRKVRLIELVSSPLALVSPLVGSAPEKNLKAFPPTGPREERQPVRYLRDVATYDGPSIRGEPKKLSEEHGFTLSFWAAGPGRVGVRVRPWYVRAQSDAVPWTWQTELV
jgi:hypothetical protein